LGGAEHGDIAISVPTTFDSSADELVNMGNVVNVALIRCRQSVAGLTLPFPCRSVVAVDRHNSQRRL